MYELSKQRAEEVEVTKKDNHKGIRAKGAVFIREPGKKLPPYIQAQKNKKRMMKVAEEEKAYSKHQEASAQGQRAMVLMDLKKQGIEGGEAERIAEEKYQESMGVRKSRAQKESEMRVNTEAEKIFAAWDDDGDGSLNPAELRQALTLAGFNTGTDYVEVIMDEFDTDGDGMMDLDEFKVMMHVLYTGQRKKGLFDTFKALFQDSTHAIFQHNVLTDREVEKLKKIFHDADDSGDMLLDEDELQVLLVSKGFMHGQREFVFEAMRSMDTSGDGAIDFGEFLEFMAKVKDKREQAKQAQYFSYGSETAKPALPNGNRSGYLKVARFVPLLAPSFEKKWVEVQGGQVLVAESRGALARLLERRANPEVKGGRSFERDGEVVIDCAYMDQVVSSSTGNAAGTKFEATTLTESWYFKAESKDLCNAWIKDVVLWRDHANFVLYEKNFADVFADEGEEAAAAQAAAAAAKEKSRVEGGADNSSSSSSKNKKSKKLKSKSRQGSLLDPLGLLGLGGGGNEEGETTKQASGSVRSSKKGQPSHIGNPLTGGGGEVERHGDASFTGDGSALGSALDSRGGLDDGEEDDNDPDSGTDEEEGDF